MSYRHRLLSECTALVVTTGGAGVLAAEYRGDWLTTVDWYSPTDFRHLYRLDLSKP